MESNAFLSKEEEAPLTACQKCKSKSCIKTQKICEKVERLLTKAGIHSANWIRPMMPSHKRNDGLGKWREIPMSSMDYNRDNNYENDFTETIV
jgi:hypothetical protein